MQTSDLLKIMAEANRKKGYDNYADSLDNEASVKEAEEIKDEDRD